MAQSDQAPIQETPDQPALKKAITPKLLVLFIVDSTELAIVLVMVYASPRVKVFSIISLLVDMTSTLAW